MMISKISRHHEDEREPIRISLLVPFKPDNKHRVKVWRWLRRYWGYELPEAEIVMGTDISKPFCKTAAVNDAASRARGDIFVILDADTYISGKVIRRCADRIEAARRQGHHLWFVPYRRVFRLTPEASERVIESDPRRPTRFPSPPDHDDVEGMEGSSFGHLFGAMIQILPREAFELVGGMDPRFRGWGGEDVAFVRAVDTLYGKHKTSRNDVLHLWHPKHGKDWRTREWQGQSRPRINDNLAMRYHVATGDHVRMRALVDEGHALHRSPLAHLIDEVEYLFDRFVRWLLRR